MHAWKYQFEGQSEKNYALSVSHPKVSPQKSRASGFVGGEYLSAGPLFAAEKRG